MTSEQIVDLGEFGDAFVADPYPVYAELRERGPVHQVRLPEGEHAWLIVGYHEARAALAEPSLSKSWRNSAMWDDIAADPDMARLTTHMLNSDPPQHTRLRKLVAREFTARRVEAMRPRVQRITDDLLDAMASGGDGHADLVRTLAFPLPITVICELLGVPFMDREAFRAWSNELLAPTDQAAADRAAADMSGYLQSLVKEKRERPGDDLMSALVRTTDEDGDRLTPDELTSMAFLLLLAGHETTVNLISNGVLALLRHPKQLAALRADFGLIDDAVEEMLRYDGPVETATFRFTTEPYACGGTVIPGGGQNVLVALASADRSAARFPDADDFDIFRPPGGHLAFGHGMHFCMGAPLARLEGQVAVRSLLECFPDLALDTAPGGLDWRPGMLIRGVRRLPVRWTPAS